MSDGLERTAHLAPDIYTLIQSVRTAVLAIPADSTIAHSCGTPAMKFSQLQILENLNALEQISSQQTLLLKEDTTKDVPGAALAQLNKTLAMERPVLAHRENLLEDLTFCIESSSKYSSLKRSRDEAAAAAEHAVPCVTARLFDRIQKISAAAKGIKGLNYMQMDGEAPQEGNDVDVHVYNDHSIYTIRLRNDGVVLAVSVDFYGLATNEKVENKMETREKVGKFMADCMEIGDFDTVRREWQATSGISIDLFERIVDMQNQWSEQNTFLPSGILFAHPSNLYSFVLTPSPSGSGYLCRIDRCAVLSTSSPLLPRPLRQRTSPSTEDETMVEAMVALFHGKSHRLWLGSYDQEVVNDHWKFKTIVSTRVHFVRVWEVFVESLDRVSLVQSEICKHASYGRLAAMCYPYLSGPGTTFAYALASAVKQHRTVQLSNL
eukprot:ANDGO_04877.mRNA.1 hypothetical protein